MALPRTVDQGVLLLPRCGGDSPGSGGMQYLFDKLDVLVVDDSDQMRHYLKSVLEIFRVPAMRAAADGSEAMRLIREDPPGLLITDLQMSPTDGIELVRWLRNAPDSPDRFIPAIMVTASTDTLVLAQARNAGLHAILTKPVTPQALGESIASIVNDPLPYIRTRNYFGPDRRRTVLAAPSVERRVPAAGTAA